MQDDDHHFMRSVTVRLYGPLADLTDPPTIIIDVPGDATARDALQAATQVLPALAPWAERCAVADDDTYLPPEEPLGTRTSICLIPPVSGG